MEIKKGDIVGRISYGKDILFYVSRIIKQKNGKDYAILKGIQYRIEANAPLEDLEKIEKSEIQKEKRGLETKLKQRIGEKAKGLFAKENKNLRGQASNALILHLDGDKRYTQKSERYYRKIGLKAIVKNIPENRQPQVIRRIN